MFNYGIFRKTALDYAFAVLASMSGLVAFVVIFSWAMLNMGTELLTFVSKFPLLQKMFEMSLGIQVDGEVSINILFAICFTHMIVFMLAWFVIISAATRVTVGEIEQGTADLLLSLPVTRTEVYVSNSVVLLMITTLVSFIPLLGIWISTQIFDVDEPVQPARFLAPACNFFCLNIAIVGLALFSGCILTRRGAAIGVVGSVIFVSLVLNFAAPFVDAIEKVWFLSLLSFYRPVDVVRENQWPVIHLIILMSIGLISWTIGLVIYVRKDVPTA